MTLARYSLFGNQRETYINIIIPSQRDELLRFSFIGFSLVEASGLIGLVMSFVLLFGI